MPLIGWWRTFKVGYSCLIDVVYICTCFKLGSAYEVHLPCYAAIRRPSKVLALVAKCLQVWVGAEEA